MTLVKLTRVRLRAATGRISLCLACASLAPVPVGASAAQLSLPLPRSAPDAQAAPSLSIGIPPILKVEAPAPVEIELPSLPAIELPSLPKVEVTLPKVEAAPLLKVEVAPSPPAQAPSTPTSSTPTPTPTPAPTTPTTPSTPVAQPPGTASGSAADGATLSIAATTTSASAGGARGTNPAGGAAPAAEPSRSRPLWRARAGTAKRRHPHGQGSGARLLAASGLTETLARSSSTRAASGLESAGRVHGRRATGASSPLDAIGRHIPIPLPVPDWSKPIILLLLIAALWFGLHSRLIAVRAHRLEGQRDVLLQDLGAMQAALVPVIPRRMGDLATSVAYRPADGPAAGGDFYDVFVLESSNVAVILGDVAGHGHHALAQAALTRYTLRAYLQAGLEPRAALALAGSVLADSAAAHFATVVVGVYDRSKGTLTYASAGHPPPISIGCHAPEPLTVCCSPPVGWDVPTGRRQTTVSLPAGAAVCFFSDGLVEARTAGGLLGRERLTRILNELGPRPLACDLLERVQARASTPDDMVSCILIAETSSCTTNDQVEELEVDAADLDGHGAERFLTECGVPAPETVTAIARSRGMLDAGETAVLRVERSVDGRATVAVVCGLNGPVGTSATAVGMSATAAL
jgi:Stage II sporulation protein E (SpoIIE)